MEKVVEVISEEELIKTLPKTNWLGGKEFELFKYQGFWSEEFLLKNIINCQANFIAKDTDVFITSLPKTGTTWLKSLLYSVVNRNDTTISQTPLLHRNPHDLVPGLETDIFTPHNVPNYVDQISDPRLLSSHIPYSSLPETIRSSKAKIIHITRNPFDMLVSQYYFIINMKKRVNQHFKAPTFEQYFEEFCFDGGLCNFGPYFEKVLKYWNASIELPNKVLFLKYEELKTHPKLHLKTLAEFLGMPFSIQEENDGVIDDIIELCSFKNIKELAVNKNGTATFNKGIEKKSFFRKGEVGDWTNHFTPLMVEKMHQLMKEQLKGTSLSFEFSTTI